MQAKRGHILPLTLVLLALSAAVLARVCRQSMRDSLAASREAERLQERWGILSCQSTLLPRAEAVLAAQEARSHRPAPFVNAQLVLGGMRFALTFADEQAKANLNLLYDRGGPSAAEKAVREQLRAARASAAVRLRPMKKQSGADAGGLPAFDSFGQVLDGPAPATIAAAVSRRLTCWGSGKLNARRADPVALSAVFGDKAQSVQKMLAQQATQVLAGNNSSLEMLVFLDQSAQGKAQPEKLQVWTQAIAGIAAPPSDVQKLLADSSDCHSLWISTGGWTRLVVEETGSGNRVSCFDW